MNTSPKKSNFKAVEAAKANAVSVREKLDGLAAEASTERKEMNESLVHDHTTAKLAILADQIDPTAKVAKPPRYEMLDETVA